MSHEPAAPPAFAPDSLVDYVRTLDCIHCGLCLQSCPTYRLTGAEPSSPRGRIHLMRGVAEGRLEADAAFADEMGFCLVCRNCESVCPAGVEFGAMMEYTRDSLAPRAGLLVRALRRVGLGLLSRRWALGLGATALGLAQSLGLTALIGRVGGARGRALAAQPRVPKRAERRALPALTPARGEREASVVMLSGCVMPELLGRVNRATARVLSHAGLDVHAPLDPVCCGALHAHNGELEGARRLARETIEAFERAAPQADCVVNSAGCGAHMKDYGRLLADDPAWSARAESFSARVRDLSEVLASPPCAARLAAAALRAPAVATPLVWDDPCHLCHGQGVRAEPRQVLDRLPGMQRAELPGSESCCGSAGLYSLLRPLASNAILDERLDALRASGARTLVTGNPGCQLQWTAGARRAGLELEVLHLAQVVERSLDES